MSAPDPLDQAAVRVLPDATATAAEVDSHMVRLSDAKRIRDEAYERGVEDGAIHVITDAGDVLADIDRTLASAELEPVEHVSELLPGFDPVACVHDLINTAALTWMTDEADTRSWADVALDVLNDSSNWDVVRLYLAEAGLFPGSVH